MPSPAVMQAWKQLKDACRTLAHRCVWEVWLGRESQLGACAQVQRHPACQRQRLAESDAAFYAHHCTAQPLPSIAVGRCIKVNEEDSCRKGIWSQAAQGSEVGAGDMLHEAVHRTRPHS
jgi:hypothetical protein